MNNFLNIFILNIILSHYEDFSHSFVLVYQYLSIFFSSIHTVLNLNGLK